MSFSALDGLPMGTRVGDLDPAVVLYLISERGMSASDVSTLLYKRSGLLGEGVYYLVLRDASLGILSASSSDIKVSARLEP